MVKIPQIQYIDSWLYGFELFVCQPKADAGAGRSLDSHVIPKKN